jgi:hypothetical protein
VSAAGLPSDNRRQRSGGLLLAAAAALFGTAWALMPGVGVTDPNQIFTLVAPQRLWVAASVIVQLASAALYGPALVAMLASAGAEATPMFRRGVMLLLVGAMGSAADATLHLLAFAMTMPGLDAATLVTVMAFMQGPGLWLLAPMILCFFIGGVLLSRSLAAQGIAPAAHVWIHALALIVAIGGGALASAGVLSPRLVGVAALGLVSLAQALAGVAWRNASPSPRGALRSAAVSAAVLIVLTSATTTIEAAQATPVATTPGKDAAVDRGWPRTYVAASGSRVEIFAPQIASWDRQAHLVAYAAVAYTPPNAERPVLGTIKVESETRVALEPRLVSLTGFRIVEANFGALDRDRIRTMVADIGTAIPAGERVIALDRVLASLDSSRITAANAAGLKADPPAIFVSNRPAILVAFDGDPIWSPIAGVDLRYAVNTNWDVFEHGPTKTFYLRHDRMWLTARTVRGPWALASALPDSFARLPVDENWKAVTISLPLRRASASDAPTVFVSTAPAELIVFRGAPDYVLVSAPSALLWAHNTDSDVFRLGKNGRVYYLVAGRWFSAPDFPGPWTFATPTLPADFARIPVEHARSRVLASVPGTPQAAEAVVLAQLPQTATVDRRQLKAPDVRYQGEPQFVRIESTAVDRAINTDRDVLRVGGRYYLCVQGVWFVAATPLGAWEVAGVIPAAIYAIPVNSPAHHVTYVTVVNTDSDRVTFATAPGYSGVMVAWGCAVWGTGYYYAPYVWSGGMYPVYYPYALTYGAAAWYSPWTGAYQRGAAAYGPYGGVAAAARYNPSTGVYSRGAMAWGPYGANGAAQAWNPRTGAYGQTHQGSGVYGSWGSSYVQRGDDWAQTARVTNDVTGTTRRVTRTDNGGMVSGSGPNGSGFVAAGDSGLYAGHDGNVYRRADGGGWQKYENGSWGATTTAADRGATGQLDRDRAARIDGGQRVRDRGAYQGGARSAGANRPSGARGSGARPSGRRR